MKKFLITVDTEGDNLWDLNSDHISTENSLFIPRFQQLCEKYGFIPTYFTNFEMANDERWIEFGKRKSKEGLCEIGLHIHAWNNPPEYSIKKVYGYNSYITEYPEEVIYRKIQYLKSVLEEKFETTITSCRSGRWATDEKFYSAIEKCQIFVDCSETPQLNLSALPGYGDKKGNDYRSVPCSPRLIYDSLVEVPMTTRRYHHVEKGSFLHMLKTLLLGDDMWLRPHKKNLQNLVYLANKVSKESDNEYLEFMIHSSELMPGGSVYFKTEDSIEELYTIMDEFFGYVKSLGYEGCGVSSYARQWKQNHIRE